MANNTSAITVFAETTFRNQFKKFGIKTDDRRRHMYIIGKTGMGKSTLMENMIVEDIRAGRGVAVVDPHGELAEKVIKFIPDYRAEDVVYFNPADTDHPIAFNIVEQVEPHLRHLVASGLIGVFKKLWADSWGPRLEYILRNAILAVLDYEGSTLLAITRMLADKQFRKKVVDSIQDPVVKAFWVKEFAGYQDKFASEAVAPIQNKVGQFLSSSLVRNIIGQSKSSIDIREIMDNKKILIMNLSKGRIGEDNTQLLGAMMITKIQLAAMSRVDMPENDRNDFYLYVDEFQNFATDSFANILSEARKYRLNLIMGHQYIEQLSEIVGSAVFGNVGTLVVYRVGATDAESLVKEFTPVFTEEDLVNLPKFNFCLKLMIDGVASDPFTARCLPPLAASEITGNESVVINLSRQKYAAEKEKVEQDIASWHEEDFMVVTKPPLVANIDSQAKPWQAPANNTASTGLSTGAPSARPSYTPNSNYQKPLSSTPSAAPSSNSAALTHTQSSPSATYNKPPYSAPAKAPSGFEVECSSCGKLTRISFEPDGIRPVFCKECLVKSKEDRKRQADARRLAKEKELSSLVKPASNFVKSPQQGTVSRTQATYQKPVIQAAAQSASSSAAVKSEPVQKVETIVSSAAPVNSDPSIDKTPVASQINKEVTAANHSKEEVAVSSGPEVELSLSDLSTLPARDFRGRPLEQREVSKEPKANPVTPVLSGAPVLSRVEGEGEKTLYESQS